MKKMTYSNCRVEVYPKGHVFGIPLFRDVTEEREACETIADQIRKHVDRIEAVYVVSDSQPVCEYCGSPWTEDGNEYNGGCCKRDEEQENTRNKVFPPSEG